MAKEQEKITEQDKKLLRLCFISDTHNKHKQVELELEGVDFLIHTGDFSSTGKEHQVRNFNEWIGKLGMPRERVIVIAGNHDWFFEENEREQIDELCTNFTYLQKESYELDGLKFYGAPQQPEFCNWAFNVARGEALRKIWAKIPEDTDVLLTHGPPFGILDTNKFAKKCGCEELLIRVQQLQPKIHAFGHIHEEHGLKQIEDTIYINSSILDEHYQPVNKAIYLDIPSQ